MKIEELMKPGERVVWQGEKKGLCSLKAAALHSKWLIPAVITGVFCTSVIIMQLISFGWEETLFSPFASVYPFLMMPVWIYLYGIITRKKQKTGAARYCVTNRGVYIETGREGEESTELLYLEHLQKTRVVLNDIDRMDHLGDVVCTYDSSDTEFTIRSIPDYQEVSALIRKLSEERRAEKEKELRQRGKSAAEQFRVPTPLDRQPKYKYKRRAESLAEQAEQADRAYAETMHDVVPETEPMPEALAEALRAERSRKAKKEKKTAAVQGDPDAAFFGGAVAAVPAAGELSFLDPDYASDTEVIEALPEDSVADLQSELFGAHAEQQGAFPDPAVNPLPFFPEQFAEPMQEVPLPQPQPAPVYGNPASPFALPPEQRGAWRMGDDPEMKSLEAPPPESDDPMHQGQLMQGM